MAITYQWASYGYLGKWKRKLETRLIVSNSWVVEWIWPFVFSKIYYCTGLIWTRFQNLQFIKFSRGYFVFHGLETKRRLVFTWSNGLEIIYLSSWEGRALRICSSSQRLYIWKVCAGVSLTMFFEWDHQNNVS